MNKKMWNCFSMAILNCRNGDVERLVSDLMNAFSLSMQNLISYSS